jgi:purine nucleosidase
VNGETLPLVLDTDLGTDVDDALALAYAARHPRIELRAVTTVSADAVARARMAAHLLALGGHSGIEVAAGIGGNDERAWYGHEGKGLAGPWHEQAISRRHGVDVLTSIEPGTSIAAVGMLSNIAAAIGGDPAWHRLPPRVAVMGGVFAPLVWEDTSLPPRRDHNLMVDPEAAVTALNADLPLLYVPCDVTFSTALETRHLDALRGGDALCRALASLIDVWTPVLHARAGGHLRLGRVAALHDPLTVAALVEPDLVTVERLPVSVAVHRGVVRTFIDPLEGQPVDVVRDVDPDAFADHWLDVVLG